MSTPSLLATWVNSKVGEFASLRSPRSSPPSSASRRSSRAICAYSSYSPRGRAMRPRAAVGQRQEFCPICRSRLTPRCPSKRVCAASVARTAGSSLLGPPPRPPPAPEVDFAAWMSFPISLAGVVALSGLTADEAIARLVAVTLLVTGLFAPIAVASNAPMAGRLIFPAVGWLWLFGGNFVLTRWRFPRFPGGEARRAGVPARLSLRR